MKKHILFLFICLALAFAHGIVNAQAPDTIWTRRYNDPANAVDRGYGFAVGGTGYLYVTGHSNNGSNDDYFTIKYNATTGDTTWTRRYNGPDNGIDNAFGCAVDNSGNLFVTGISYNGSNFDYLTIKYNATTGDTIWTSRYNGPANSVDFAFGCAVDTAGNIYVTGSSKNGLNDDYLTIKYNSTNGDTVWTRRYNGPANNNDRTWRCVVDVSGNLYVTGYSNNGSNNDYLTIKYNSTTGDTIWTRRYNSPANAADNGNGCAIDASGNLYVTGYTNNGSNEDYLTIKYNSNTGDTIWTRRYNGSANSLDNAFGCAVDTSGNLYVTGYSSNGSNYDYLTIKYNSTTGDTIWTRRDNGSANNYDYAFDCSVDGSGYLYVTGYSNNGSNDDYLTIKFNKYSLSILSPNGGETWPGGLLQSIRWKEIGVGFSYYNLLLSKNGGDTYIDTIASNISAADTMYNWQLPLLDLTTCRVKVQIIDSLNNIVSEDASNADFSIRSYPTVVLPNGGETWSGDSLHMIKWSVVGANFDRYRLLLSINGGVTYNDTISDTIDPAELVYNWQLPMLNCTTCRIKIQILDSLNAVISEDASNSNFTIRLYSLLISPNGGQIWQTNENKNIQWRITGLKGPSIDHYRILYSTDNGVAYSDTLIATVNSLDSVYTWQIPNITSYYCKTKVQCVDISGNVLDEDDSDTAFEMWLKYCLVEGQYPIAGYNSQRIRRVPCQAADANTITWYFPTDSAIVAEPIVGPNGMIYMISDNDSLYSLTAGGARNWARYIARGTKSGLAFAFDSTIYFGNGNGQVLAYRNDNTFKWSYDAGGSIASSPVIEPNGVVYFGSTDDTVYAVDKTGATKWKYATGGDVVSSPAFASSDTVFYIGCDDGKLYALDTAGVKVWSFSQPSPIKTSTAVLGDSVIYFGTASGKLYAIYTDGLAKWQYQVNDSITSSPAIGKDGTVYFGCHNDTLYAIDGEGNFKWGYKTGDKIVSSPVVDSAGHIYFGSNDGYVYALNSNGSLLWKRLTGGSVRSSPAVSSAGSVYIGSDDGRLYCFGTVTGIESQPAETKIVKAFGLYDLYPNPTKGSVNISYNIPSASDVVLTVYNVAGQLVDKLALPGQKAGEHAVKWKPNISKGVYFYMLVAGKHQAVRKIVHIK